MVKIDEITEKDIDIVKELFWDENPVVYVTNTAEFRIKGNTIRCVLSDTINPDMKTDILNNEMKILKLKRICEDIFGFNFLDLRKEISN